MLSYPILLSLSKRAMLRSSAGAPCGTDGAVERVVPGRGEQPSALPTPPLSARGRREQGKAQASVQRQDGSTKPFADQ